MPQHGADGKFKGKKKGRPWAMLAAALAAGAAGGAGSGTIREVIKPCPECVECVECDECPGAWEPGEAERTPAPPGSAVSRIIVDVRGFHVQQGIFDLRTGEIRVLGWTPVEDFMGYTLRNTNWSRAREDFCLKFPAECEVTPTE